MVLWLEGSGWLDVWLAGRGLGIPGWIEGVMRFKLVGVIKDVFLVGRTGIKGA